MLIDLNPKKTIRILVYPNITSKDYNKDSYVDVLHLMIKHLNEISDRYYFYILSPKYIEKLDFPNTHQFYIDIPTHSPSMRLNFNLFEIDKIIDWKKLDIDLVFSHLPEHTLELSNFFSYQTHIEPLYFGYSHWFDFPKIVTWKDTFMKNINGLLEMDKCFANTQSQIDLVIDTSKEIYSDKIINELKQKLKPLYLGVDEKDIIHNINPNYEKIIVFNHRPWTYKDYPNFLKTMDCLYQKRQDFKVWVPLSKSQDREYIIIDKFSKKEYYKRLSECCVGFSPRQNYRGWSIATTDGLMNGCPYILYDEAYNREIFPEGDFFKTNSDSIPLIEKYLDHPQYRNMMAEKSLNNCKKRLIFKQEVIQLNEYILNLYSQIKTVQSDGALNRLIEIIKSEKNITKKDLLNKMRWGVGIKWTKYRSALMNHPNIFDCDETHSRYIWRN
jgi:glycosyltransferase involved in cell wall biosynthesis